MPANKNKGAEAEAQTIPIICEREGCETTAELFYRGVEEDAFSCLEDVETLSKEFAPPLTIDDWKTMEEFTPREETPANPGDETTGDTPGDAPAASGSDDRPAGAPQPNPVPNVAPAADGPREGASVAADGQERTAVLSDGQQFTPKKREALVRHLDKGGSVRLRNGRVITSVKDLPK